MSIFVRIPCLPAELCLEVNLLCGQAFRWKQLENGKLRGVIKNYAVTLHRDNEYLHAEIHNPSPLKLKECDDSNKQDDKYENLLKDYFRLNVCLVDLYKKWADTDSNFASQCVKFPGVRMLSQDPVENLFSFICSSNNNIQRISQLVNKLSSIYGKHLITIDGTQWYNFPTVTDLMIPGVEDTLRDQGFGYRAKYIAQSANKIMEYGGEDWLLSLRSLSSSEASMELQKLPGIGPKVADCICLMSLGHLDSIPVDTHVYQFTVRGYLPELKDSKSLTKKIYKQISDYHKNLFGEYAGWANSILFCADLKKFDGKKEQVKELDNNKRKKCK